MSLLPINDTAVVQEYCDQAAHWVRSYSKWVKVKFTLEQTIKAPEGE
jgi:hypothetical protein